MIIYSVFGHKCDKLQRVVLRLKSYNKVPLDSRSVIILVFVFSVKLVVQQIWTHYWKWMKFILRTHDCAWLEISIKIISFMIIFIIYIWLPLCRIYKKWGKSRLYNPLICQNGASSKLIYHRHKEKKRMVNFFMDLVNEWWELKWATFTIFRKIICGDDKLFTFSIRLGNILLSLKFHYDPIFNISTSVRTMFALLVDMINVRLLYNLI